MFEEYVGKWFRDDRYNSSYFFIKLWIGSSRAISMKNYVVMNGFSRCNDRRVFFYKSYAVGNLDFLKYNIKEINNKEASWLSRKTIRSIFGSD